MYPTAKDVGAYQKAYREKYIPDELLKLGCEVTSIIREEENGCWKVEWRGNDTGVEKFDFLAVCSGFFSVPYTPPIPGLDNFAGTLLHSAEYALSKLDLSEKRKIVVVGGSMSGAEVAADLALRVSSLPAAEAEKVEILQLIPRPFWILPRYLPLPSTGDPTTPKFIPLDLVLHDFNQRHAAASQPPKSLDETLKEINYIMKGLVGGDQSESSPELCIEEKYMQQAPWLAISDSYINFVRSGAIKLITGHLSGIPLTSPNTITVKPESCSDSAEEIPDIDTIIMATGYYPASTLKAMFSQEMFASLTASPSLAPPDPNFLPLLLYNQTLHPAFQNTGGIVGVHKSPFFGIMELQGRWLAGLFSGELTWPSTEDMNKEIETHAQSRERRADPTIPEFRPQWSGPDYLGIVNDLRERVGLPNNPPATTYTPNPMIPAHFSTSPESIIALTSLQNFLTATPKVPPFTANAIFRSLHGKWKLSRRIDSRHNSYPSGNFTGTAEFLPREPTFSASPRSEELEPGPNSSTCSTRLVTSREKPEFSTPGGEILEYLYTESGSFTTDNGLAIQGRRNYIYRYHPEEDVITVWFVKADGGVDVDYFFHEVSILPAGGQAEEEGAGGVDKKGGWKAGSKHLCRNDWYWPAYRFMFRRGSGEMEKFAVRYRVSGPSKDYVAEGKYQR